jgi:hypothetical protein
LGLPLGRWVEAVVGFELDGADGEGEVDTEADGDVGGVVTGPAPADWSRTWVAQ